LADHARDNAEGRYGDLPLEIVAKLVKDSLHADDPLASVPDWAQAIEDARREAAEQDFGKPRYQDRLVNAVSPTVPEDAVDQVRRRVLPYLRWRAEILRKDGKGDARNDDAPGGEA